MNGFGGVGAAESMRAKCKGEGRGGNQGPKIAKTVCGGAKPAWWVEKSLGPQQAGGKNLRQH